MKLSAHYNKASILISVVVLFAGAIIYYFAIHRIARNQLDDELSEEISERINYVNQFNKLPKKDFDQSITAFKKVATLNYSTRYYDTVYYDAKEKTNEDARAIDGLIKLNGEKYVATVIESYDSINDLIQIITVITLLLMIFLLGIIIITNKYVLNGLWRPFYTTLNELNDFNVSDGKAFLFKSNKVDEFNELNKAVQKMSSRVKSDYQHLKQFTENASHEMMTPLSVITSKLDTLIQDETLKPEQLDQINDIYSAASKLSRLNQSLLLLVKIENNLINDLEILNLDHLVAQKVKQFNELLADKNINVILHTTPKEIFASKYLIDILLNNLFSNAIRHNITHGSIYITLTENNLIFQNTGLTQTLSADMLFERFQKGQKSDGTGLGLTIVKNVCNLYGWEICYAYENSFHIFNMAFNGQILMRQSS